MERLDKIIVFLKEIDKLKTVERVFELANGRKENSAEHTWHMALMLMCLEKELEGIDFLKTYKMVLIHDLVEIYDGDYYFTDKKRREGKHEREKITAKKLFGMLPDDLGDEFFSLWEEFELRESNEAKVAQALDKIQALMQGLFSYGKEWKEWQTTKQQIYEHKWEQIKSNEITKKMAERLYEEVKKLDLLP